MDSTYIDLVVYSKDSLLLLVLHISDSSLNEFHNNKMKEDEALMLTFFSKAYLGRGLKSNFDKRLGTRRQV